MAKVSKRLKRSVDRLKAHETSRVVERAQREFRKQGTGYQLHKRFEKRGTIETELLGKRIQRSSETRMERFFDPLDKYTQPIIQACTCIQYHGDDDYDYAVYRDSDCPIHSSNECICHILDPADCIVHGRTRYTGFMSSSFSVPTLVGTVAINSGPLADLASSSVQAQSTMTAFIESVHRSQNAIVQAFTDAIRSVRGESNNEDVASEPDNDVSSTSSGGT